MARLALIWLLLTAIPEIYGLMVQTPWEPRPRSVTVRQAQGQNERASKLDESFEIATSVAADAVMTCISRGKTLMRIDFDTSNGDATYTTLKNSLEFTRYVAANMANAMMTQDPDAQLCLFFPDAGAAALAAQQWKLGTPEAMLSDNVNLKSFPRDKPSSEDSTFLIICPRASEASAVEVLIDDVARTQLKPTILMNPELVDMGTTGYGFAGRLLKQRLLDGLTQAYLLKTLPWGALALTYPNLYSIYQEDETSPDGYTLLTTRPTQPNGEDLEEIYAEYNKQDDEDGGLFGGIASGFSRFADGFSKL